MTAPRTTRENVGIEDTACAMTRFGMEFPRDATIQIASSVPGIARKMSMIRMMIMSVFPPKYPAAAPRIRPTVRETATVTTPMERETVEPYMTRSKMSRPISSVPNQWSALGAWRASL